jgi:hypothetical protein
MFTILYLEMCIFNLLVKYVIRNRGLLALLVIHIYNILLIATTEKIYYQLQQWEIHNVESI